MHFLFIKLRCLCVMADSTTAESHFLSHLFRMETAFKKNCLDFPPFKKWRQCVSIEDSVQLTSTSALANKVFSERGSRTYRGRYLWAKMLVKIWTLLTTKPEFDLYCEPHVFFFFLDSSQQLNNNNNNNDTNNLFSIHQKVYSATQKNVWSRG